MYFKQGLLYCSAQKERGGANPGWEAAWWNKFAYVQRNATLSAHVAGRLFPGMSTSRPGFLTWMDENVEAQFAWEWNQRHTKVSQTRMEQWKWSACQTLRGKSRRRNLEKDVKVLLPQAGIEPRYWVVHRSQQLNPNETSCAACLPASVWKSRPVYKQFGDLEKFSNTEQESNLDVKHDSQWSKRLRLTCLDHDLNPALLHQRQKPNTVSSPVSNSQRSRSNVQKNSF